MTKNNPLIAAIREAAYTSGSYSTVAYGSCVSGRTCAAYADIVRAITGVPIYFDYWAGNVHAPDCDFEWHLRGGYTANQARKAYKLIAAMAAMDSRSFGDFAYWATLLCEHNPGVLGAARAAQWKDELNELCNKYGLFDDTPPRTRAAAKFVNAYYKAVCYTKTTPPKHGGTLFSVADLEKAVNEYCSLCAAVAEKGKENLSAYHAHNAAVFGGYTAAEIWEATK